MLSRGRALVTAWQIGSSRRVRCPLRSPRLYFVLFFAQIFPCNYFFPAGCVGRPPGRVSRRPRCPRRLRPCPLRVLPRHRPQLQRKLRPDIWLWHLDAQWLPRQSWCWREPLASQKTWVIHQIVSYPLLMWMFSFHYGPGYEMFLMSLMRTTYNQIIRRRCQLPFCLNTLAPAAMFSKHLVLPRLAGPTSGGKSLNEDWAMNKCIAFSRQQTATQKISMIFFK